MSYQTTIHSFAPNLNPAGVEAFMRSEHGTLDHLPREAFRIEAKAAGEIEKDEPGYLKLLAASYGMLPEYEAWEAKLKPAS